MLLDDNQDFYDFDITDLGRTFPAVDARDPPQNTDTPPARYRVTVEDAPEEDNDTASGRYGEPFPNPAGRPIDNSRRPTVFDQMQAEFPLNDGTCGPFRNEDEWELAEWMVKTLGKGEIDAFRDDSKID